MNLSDKSFYCYVYAFGFLWTISTSFVFVFLSPFYSARYLYVSYIGLFFIVIISLGELLNFNLIKKIKAGSVFFLCLILFFGISRYSYLKQTYRIHNSSREKIISQTKIGKMPLNSQIVIVDFGTTGGWWIWSTGYIQYITKRNDLTGIIGPARSFYNPMKPWKKFYDPDSIMNGLELGKPIFLFKYDRKTGFLNSYIYALQWLENHRNSEWIIYEFSPASGKNVIKEKGVGFNEYIKKDGSVIEFL